MKHVILPVGPQYAGKSTYCKGLLTAHPEVVYVSRDEILTEMFGTAWLNPYTGHHSLGLEKMWRIVAQYLRRREITLILDTWNGFTDEREEIVAKLRLLGVNRVDAWRFMTPLQTCFEWSLKREPVGEGRSEKWTQFRLESRRLTCEENWHLFDSQPLGDRLFDQIVEINPLAPPSPDPLSRDLHPA